MPQVDLTVCLHAPAEPKRDRKRDALRGEFAIELVELDLHAWGAAASPRASVWHTWWACWRTGCWRQLGDAECKSARCSHLHGAIPPEARAEAARNKEVRPQGRAREDAIEIRDGIIESFFGQVEDARQVVGLVTTAANAESHLHHHCPILRPWCHERLLSWPEDRICALLQ